MITATALTLGALALIWFVAVPFGTGICPTIDPSPSNCLASYRAGSGLVATIVVIGVWGVTIVVAVLATVLRASWARGFAVAGVVLLALAPVVSYAAVAGSPGFTLTAQAPDPPTDGPVGQWGEIGERSAYLTIVADGTVTGSDGCNGMSGTWSTSGGVVEFSDMFMTLMMCPHNPSDLHGPMVTAIAKGDRLYVLDADGDLSGVLHRVAG